MRRTSYITTPKAILDADAVFVDELNRTRHEVQNKLFPIIHERQRVDLENLYRWAAMNSATDGDQCEQDAVMARLREPFFVDGKLAV